MNWSSTTDDTNQFANKCKGLGCYSDNVTLFLTVITCFLAVFGTVTNGLSLITIITGNYFENINYNLIGHLNFADALYLSLVLPLQASAFYYRSWLLPHWACLLLAFIRTWLIGVIMNLLSAIALYRVLFIVLPHFFYCMKKKKFLYLIISFIWMEPFLLTVTPILGIWGSYDFDELVLQCTFNSRTPNRSHKAIITTFGYFFPCFLIISCYTYIAVIVHNKRKVSQLNTIEKWKETGRQHTLSVNRMLLILFLNFFIGVTPFYIINTIDPYKLLPLAHVTAVCFAWLSYCTNPFIYSIMDKSFWDACEMFCLCHFLQIGNEMTSSRSPESPSKL